MREKGFGLYNSWSYLLFSLPSEFWVESFKNSRLTLMPSALSNWKVKSRQCRWYFSTSVSEIWLEKQMASEVFKTLQEFLKDRGIYRNKGKNWRRLISQRLRNEWHNKKLNNFAKFQFLNNMIYQKKTICHSAVWQNWYFSSVSFYGERFLWRKEKKYFILAKYA